MDSIIWAFRHTERNIAETGLNLLLEMLKNFQACTFLACSDLKKPSSRLAFTIGDSVKPKTGENITVEMKLRCLSVTVQDSSCGMVRVKTRACVAATSTLNINLSAANL
ncbi:hypothetical protein U1Q18_037191 [Sarracenia purpurea var. burkii]